MESSSDLANNKDKNHLKITDNQELSPTKKKDSMVGSAIFIYFQFFLSYTILTIKFKSFSHSYSNCLLHVV